MHAFIESRRKTPTFRCGDAQGVGLCRPRAKARLAEQAHLGYIFLNSIGRQPDERSKASGCPRRLLISRCGAALGRLRRLKSQLDMAVGREGHHSKYQPIPQERTGHESPKISTRWGINGLHERQSDGTCPAAVLTVAAPSASCGEYVTRFIARHIRRQDVLFLLLSAFLVILYTTTAGGGFALDDSWIHQTYARNLAETGQWAFVPGVPSAASTSPLFTVLLVIGYKLSVNYLLWTYALGALVLAITGMLGARLAEQVLPEQGYIGLVTGLALVLAWHLIWSAASGMETMLFGMMTLALIWLAWRELEVNHSTHFGSLIQRGTLFGALAALAILSRPEGIILAGLIAGLMLLVRPQRSWRGFLLWSIGAGIGFLLLSAPYLIYNLQLTGGLLPDTAAAKQAEYASLLTHDYPTRFVRMLRPLIGGGQLLLVPGMIAYTLIMAQRLRGEIKSAVYLLPVLWAIALIGLYAARLPADYQHGRYVIPVLPSLILTGVIGLIWLARRAKPSVVGRVVNRSLIISSAIAFLYFALIVGPAAYRQDVHIINEEMVASAQWIAEHIPPGELLAVHDIGAVGYFAPRPILDLAGLVSPEIVPIIHDGEALWDLMQQREARYLMAFPDQVPGRDTDDSRLCPLFTTGGAASRSVGGPNMTIYLLAWNRACSS